MSLAVTLVELSPFLFFLGVLSAHRAWLISAEILGVVRKKVRQKMILFARQVVEQRLGSESHVTWDDLLDFVDEASATICDDVWKVNGIQIPLVANFEFVLSQVLCTVRELWKLKQKRAKTM